MTFPCGCPEHFPDWDGKDIDLGGQPVLDFPMRTFLHMPTGYEVYLGRVRKIMTDLELKEQWPGFYISKTGWMKGKIISLLESGDSPSRHVVRLERPFQFRAALHKGTMGTIKNTVKAMQADLLDSGRMPKELLLSYLTCPNCSEQRGGDMIMVLRRWEVSTRLSKRIDGRSQD